MSEANLALYRKYRSATFAEIVGQDHVTVPLRHALANGRINHAYLFSGPRGCGKTSSARILARSLNCAQGPTPDPCGVCESCVELAPNGSGSIDVIEMDAATHGLVDDARDLRERAFFAPVRDRFKVYIVDEAHMVTTAAFNALLKVVEEPPDFVIFVFATTEPDKVLTTIRSRTHHYPFRLIPPAVLRAHLESVCTQEGITIEPAVLPLVVRAGGGSARDSLSILDQLLAGAGPSGVTYAEAVALLGVTDGALLDDMVDALAAGDAAGVYGTVDRVVEAGHDPRRFSVDLLDRFRDLILLEAVPDAADRGLIDGAADQVTKMTDEALRIGGATLTRCAEIVHTALIEMRGTTAPRLVLELLCARMMLPDASSDAAAVLQRVERLERRLTAGGAGSAPVAPPQAQPTASPQAQPTASPQAQPTASPQAQPTAPSPPESTSSPSQAAPEPAAASRAAPGRQAAADAAAVPPEVPSGADPGALDGTSLRRRWPDVLERVKTASRRTRALLDNAQITDVAGDLVTLSAPPALAKMIAEDSNTSVLRAALTEEFGGQWRVTVESGPPGGGAAEQRPSGPPGPTPPSRAARREPPPPEPDPRDDADYDDRPSASDQPPDPDAAALSLLRSELGARPVED